MMCLIISKSYTETDVHDIGFVILYIPHTLKICKISNEIFKEKHQNT